MKKNYLLVASVIMAMALAGSACAAQKGANGSAGNSANGSQQQNQTVNQEEGVQLQPKNNEQVQQGNQDNGIKLQEKDQVQLQDGTGAGSQGQGQLENKGNQSGSQPGNQGGSVAGQQVRSQVANAVQEMLQIADRNEGVGEQIRSIAQEQNQNQVRLEGILEKIQSRNSFAKFLIGSDYGKISNAQSILKQNQVQLQELEQIKSQLTDVSDQQVLQEQVQLLKQVNSQIERAIGESEGGFSLLGWAFKLFSR